jgi:hypothetical protein
LPAVDIEQGDPVPVRKKPLRDREADPSSPSGDDDDRRIRRSFPWHVSLR